ncbi:GNAT family N-acetyltransferase [Bacillus cereus group sp. BfR-BA-01380]|uniref:GNAT family N-acetyltransferase n=1 Tax=Bacillus cereus group sp. BfR-BA-01380 TaxID=2920324 RepID=UPI001F55FF11|nr:GNAT family N-acetyltransferase [Bacillus cereus group sp. BfR-BA-01380]
MLTTLPIIMTKNGQRLESSFTGIEKRLNFIKFDIEFHDQNNSDVGTTSCRIEENHSKKAIRIFITSLDAKPSGKGIGTAMIYSIFRWAYMSYPDYELHFRGKLNAFFDEEYLISFYTKVGFTVENGYFNLIVQRNNFHIFYTDTENKIFDMYSTFMVKQKNNYQCILDDYKNDCQSTLSDIQTQFKTMSLVSFIKQRYFQR